MNSASNESGKNDTEPFHYCLFKGHTSYHSIYQEWYGTHDFDYNRNSSCYKGGIQELEKEYGMQWRSHFTPAEQKHFSRLKLTVLHINSVIERRGTTAEQVLMELDTFAKERNARTVTALEKLIKNHLTN
jgi:hypothetical protein